MATPSDYNRNVRDDVITTSSGKNVKDTSQLSGMAKDSTGGEKNQTKPYESSWSPSGPFGGMSKNK